MNYSKKDRDEYAIPCSAPKNHQCSGSCLVCKYYNYKEKQMSKDKMEMPSKEQILETAKDCPQAKDALAKLFPKAFEGEVKYCCDWMRYAVKEIDIIRISDYDCRFNQRIGKDGDVGLDIIYYCPKCGTRSGSEF